MSKMKKISRRSFLKIAASVGVGSSIFTLGACGYASQVEPKWVEIASVTVRLADLPEAFNGLKIAQLSDLHADTFITPEDVAKAVGLINSLHPDLVVITGDHVTLKSKMAFPIAAALKRLHAPLGRFAVLGNHDYRAGASVVAEAFHLHALPLLRNQNHPIERDGNRIWMAGVDDVLHRKHNLRKTLAGIPRSETIILLVHEPDYADKVAVDGRVALQLSGHSHGGQVRIPFYGAPILPKLGRKYPWGLNRIGQMQVYTSRGLGMTMPAVRINCRPEITLLTLKREMRS